MKHTALSFIGVVILAAFGAEPMAAGNKSAFQAIEAVTVPIESVTTTESDIQSHTVVMPSREALVKAVQDGESEAARLQALEQMWNQEDIFRIFFKPGKDRNTNIRLAAINRLTEIELLRVIAERVPIPELRDAANRRIKAIYRDAQDFKPNANSAAFQGYARRLTAAD